MNDLELIKRQIIEVMNEMSFLGIVMNILLFGILITLITNTIHSW